MDNQNIPTNISDIRNLLESTSNRRERSNLINDIFDQFDVHERVSNFDTDNVIRLLERKLKEENINPEENLNANLFELQDPTVNLGQGRNLRDTFTNNPNAQLRVKLPSGQIVTMSKSSYDKAIRDQEMGIDLGFTPSEQDILDSNLNGEFEILDIYNPDLLDFTRINRQNQIGGIDDLRIYIEEHSTEDYWCPSNINCIKKCMLEYLKDKPEEIEKITTLEIPDISKSNTVNKCLEKVNLKYRVSFSYPRYQEYKKEYEVIPLKEVSLKNIGTGYSHAVLLKRNINKLYKSDKEFSKVYATKLELEDIKDLSVFKESRYYEVKDKETGEIKSIPFFKPDEIEFRTNKLNLMTYDYESYQEEEPKKHVPYMVSYAYKKGENLEKNYIWNINSPKDLQSEFIKVIKKRLNEIISKDLKNKKDLTKEEKHRFKTVLTLVAHNGAGYDNHIFLRNIDDKNIKVQKYIGDGSKIKSFSFTFKDIKQAHSVRFLDTYMFTTQSLDKSCEGFSVPGKEDFDISKYLTKESCIANQKEIIKYGIQDSVCLYGLCENINSLFKEATGIDLSPLRYISLPAYAGKIRDHCSDMSNIFYHERREITDFQQKCVFGGRLVVGKLNYDSKEEGENMRNPDVNSLYPTAMANYEYPYGSSKFYKDKKHCDILKEKLNSQTYNKYSMIKCKVKVNTKCIIPLIPNKKENGSIDTTETEFICNATSVELLDAVKFGRYQILEVYIYQEWQEHKKIFKNFVDKFYNLRLEYKRLLKETGDKKYDILQTLCKLIMNASYGKIIQKPFDNNYIITTIKEWTNEIADQNTELIQVINGGRNILYKKQNKDVHDNNLPKYLGSFILSWSKHHMNKMIESVDGFFKPTIYYFDTDSLYIKSSMFDKLGNNGLIGKELGQASPDYDVDITEFVSLGKKIKFCKLTDGSLKTTFKGYGGLNKEFYKKDGDNLKTLLHKELKLNIFFKELKKIAKDELLVSDSHFMSKSIERFNKKGLDITTLELSRDFKPTYSSHYKKINNWLYPKYYYINE